MKYVIIIPDGAADHPLKELGNKTPFEAADKPATDRLSIDGRQGTVATTPHGMPCGSDVCSLSLLGYDPTRYHKGRAPLEAAAAELDFTTDDWVFRLNLVTVVDGLMQDHSAGHISSKEGQILLADFVKRVQSDRFQFYPGVSYRNIMIERSGDGNLEPDLASGWEGLVTTPPHDIPGQPISSYLPNGHPRAKQLCRLIEISEELFAGHEVNRVRGELGESPATHVWPWGQGQRPQIPSFYERFGLRGAMITAVDLLAGISKFIDWDRLEVPGQTSYHDTDYIAAGLYAIDALDKYDIVCVHVEAPDEAAHAADVITKVKAIESIDEHIVGPIREALEQRTESYRVMYLPDHYTLVSSRKHDPTPVPFVICGEGISSVLERPFHESNAQESDLHIKHGHELMEYFLYAGMGQRPNTTSQTD